MRWASWRESGGYGRGAPRPADSQGPWGCGGVGAGGLAGPSAGNQRVSLGDQVGAAAIPGGQVPGSVEGVDRPWDAHWAIGGEIAGMSLGGTRLGGL